MISRRSTRCNRQLLLWAASVLLFQDNEVVGVGASHMSTIPPAYRKLENTIERYDRYVPSSIHKVTVLESYHEAIHQDGGSFRLVLPPAGFETLCKPDDLATEADILSSKASSTTNQDQDDSQSEPSEADQVRPAAIYIDEDQTTTVGGCSLHEKLQYARKLNMYALDEYNFIQYLVLPESQVSSNDIEDVLSGGVSKHEDSAVSVILLPDEALHHFRLYMLLETTRYDNTISPHLLGPKNDVWPFQYTLRLASDLMSNDDKSANEMYGGKSGCDEACLVWVMLGLFVLVVFLTVVCYEMRWCFPIVLTLLVAKSSPSEQHSQSEHVEEDQQSNSATNINATTAVAATPGNLQRRQDGRQRRSPNNRQNNPVKEEIAKLKKEEFDCLPVIRYIGKAKSQIPLDPSVSEDIEANISSGATAPCCSICLDDFVENDCVIILPRCIHCYHKNCIEPWLLQRRGYCPLCKAAVLKQEKGEIKLTTPPRNNLPRS